MYIYIYIYIYIYKTSNGFYNDNLAMMYRLSMFLVLYDVTY